MHMNRKRKQALSSCGFIVMTPLEYWLRTRVECAACGRIIKKSFCPFVWLRIELGGCEQCYGRDATTPMPFPWRDALGIGVAIATLITGILLIIL